MGLVAGAMIAQRCFCFGCPPPPIGILWTVILAYDLSLAVREDIEKMT
jgi:hypothetical protein